LNSLGLKVSLFRDKKENGNLTDNLPCCENQINKYHADLTTIILPKGFENVTYNLEINNNDVNVSSIIPSGKKLKHQYSSFFFGNLIPDCMDKNKYLINMSSEIHPCNGISKYILSQSNDNSAAISFQQRGKELCAHLLTYFIDCQEYFKLFYFNGSITVNQWVWIGSDFTKNGKALTAYAESDLASTELPISITQKNPQGSCFFIPFLLPNNSICYYLIPSSDIEEKMKEWHKRLYEARKKEKPLLVAIDGPIYFKDDWGICFTRIASLKT